MMLFTAALLFGLELRGVNIWKEGVIVYHGFHPPGKSKVTPKIGYM